MIKYIILGLGILNLLLIVFQLLSGLHKIKVRIGLHKKFGYALVLTAVIHGVIAVLANL